MTAAYLTRLALLLSREDIAAGNATRSLPVLQLQESRKKLTAFAREIGRSGDLSLIVTAEKKFVANDLERYLTSPAQKGSLDAALRELATIETHIQLVGDPEKYRTIDQGHSLPKHRQNGLPRDEARQALLSHYTRLGNMDTSRLSDEEKTCIHVRQANLKTGVGLYAKMQAGALGLPAEFA